MARSRLKTALILGPSLLALGLAACGDNQQQAAAPPAAAPLSGYETTALPEAAPAPVKPAAADQGYQMAERAYGLQEAFNDAPPAYGFDYGDRQGMAWETEDDWAMYADPSGQDETYYYYRPNAAQPYFVRDNNYGYGFDDAGGLIALFDSRGRRLSDDRYRDAAPLAGRYYSNGADLRRAARRAPRAAVREDAWRARAPRVQATTQPWLQAARNDSDWRQWRERDGGRDTPRFKARPSRLDDRPSERLSDRRDDRLAEQRDDRRDAAEDRRERQTAQARDDVRDHQVRNDQAREREQRQQASQRADQQRRAEADRAKADQQRADQQRTQRDQAQRDQSQREKAQREKAQREKAQREKAQREKARPEKARPEAPRSEQPRADRPQRERPQQDRAERVRPEREQARPAPRPEQPRAEKPKAEKPQAEKPREARAAEKPNEGLARMRADAEKAKASVLPSRGEGKGGPDRRD